MSRTAQQICILSALLTGGCTFDTSGIPPTYLSTPNEAGADHTISPPDRGKVPKDTTALDQPKQPPSDGPRDSRPPDTNGLHVNGHSCNLGSQCQSGHCVDNLCCNNACSTKCKACNLAGKKGTCWPIQPGQDPDNECNNAISANKCGQDGTCDGKGGCRFSPLGTICKPAACVGVTHLELARECDGKGQCVTMGPNQNCAPFTCAPGAQKCRTTCNSNNQNVACAGYYACNASRNICWQWCSGDSQCKSSGKCKYKKCVKGD